MSEEDKKLAALLFAAVRDGERAHLELAQTKEERERLEREVAILRERLERLG